MFGSRRRKDQNSQERRIPNTYGIDLGTCNIKIYNSNTDRISVQKNIIAIADKKRLLAYGNDAYEMLEKAPANIRVSSPVVGGVIADIQNMEDLMVAFMKDQENGTLRSSNFFIAVPTDVTEVERRAFYDLIADSGIKARRIMVVEKAIAAGLGMGIDVKNSQGVLVVDIGYDTTEISLLSLGGIVLSRIVKIGGHVFDNSIINAVRREYNLVIGSKTAEGLRLSFNSGLARNEDGTSSIFGRDVVTGLPKEKQLTSQFVAASLQDNFHEIEESVRTILERTPPELTADIYRHGIFLTGGASQEEGLGEAFQRDFELNINMAQSPVNSVALGLSQVIRRPGYRSLAYTIEEISR